MLGRRLGGRYEVTGELGRGGMGVVYRAHDPILDRDVAIKLAPTSIDEAARERLRREATLVAGMDHPSIVPVHDMGDEDGNLFFVMPVVEGLHLRRWIDEHGVSLDEVLDLATQIALGLEYSHARGVLHRDVKPENVMVTRDQDGQLRARLMDFGLACTGFETRLTKTGALIGTLGYLSPEQVSDQEVDARSDIYALGSVLYECLVGEAPFRGEPHSLLYRIVYEQPKTPSERGIELPRALETLLMRCLAKLPPARPHSMAEIARGLKEIRDGLSSTREPAPDLTTEHKPRLGSKDRRSPFVGREREMTRLHETYDEVVAGEGKVVIVSGEAGLGKSRLISEFEGYLRARDVRVLHGRCLEQEDQLPYGGLCEVVLEHFKRRNDSASGSESLPDLGDIAADLVWHFPLLAELPQLRAAARIDRTGDAAHDQSFDPGRLHELLALTIARIGNGQPLVIVLEDLHLADVSADALTYLARRLAPTPTMILVTLRPSEIPRGHPASRSVGHLRRLPQTLEMALSPLGRNEIETLVGRMAKGAVVESGLVDQLLEITEGNPLFLVELVRSLLDVGAIVRDASSGGRLRSRAPISSRRIPLTLEQAVERRIERLDEDQADVLAMASIVGKSFQLNDLRLLAPEREDLEDQLDRLARDGLIEEKRQGVRESFGFTSAIVREAVYATLTRRRRRQGHLVLAEAWENTGSVERRAGLLLHHFSRAEDAERSVRYGMLAARQSLDAFSPDEALRSLVIVSDFLDDELFEERMAVAAEVRFLTAEAHQMNGAVDPALTAASKAMELFQHARVPEREIDAIALAARIAWDARRISEATRFVERGLEVLSRYPSFETRSELLGLAATLANLRGEYHLAAELRARAFDDVDEIPPEAQPRGGRLVVGFAADVSSIDPTRSLTVEEDEIHSNVFETLLGTDQRGELRPRLCEHWEILEGGLGIRLVLREGPRFHDGKPLTAVDVRSSLQRTMKESFARGADMLTGAIRGRAAKAGRPTGITVVSRTELRIDLAAPMPLFPALLTSPATAISRLTAAGQVPVGTGPFRLVRIEPQRICLARNDDWWGGRPANIDELEFRSGLEDRELARAMALGTIQIGRHLRAPGLRAALGDAGSSLRVVDAPKMNLYFALFNAASPLASRPALRLAASRVLDVPGLVRKCLGRLALSASGIYPPGVLGHDPSSRRRQESAPREARALVERELPQGVRTLRAAVHPVFQDRYREFLDALIASWRGIGLDFAIETPSMTTYMQAIMQAQGYDILVGRWNADYGDPDSFSHALFHSDHGAFRSWFHSDETDQASQAARSELDPDRREGLYRQIEDRLLDDRHIIPLFHDNDLCLARPEVDRLRLKSSAPWVDYSAVQLRTPAKDGRSSTSRRGRIEVPLSGGVNRLDPARALTSAACEVMPCVYETLTRIDADARVVPALAAAWDCDEESRVWRFQIKEGLRFHDGRRLTARDVRHSFERLLRWLGARVDILSVIEGAVAFAQGRASDVSGIDIPALNRIEFRCVHPFPGFPVVLTSPLSAIVPEDSPEVNEVTTPLSGTGPFRVLHFEPNLKVELEANPHYRDLTRPRLESLTFQLGLDSHSIARGFKDGSFALAADLDPEDVSGLVSGETRSAYRQSPGLSTGFCLLNARRGPLADRRVRRRLLSGLDLAEWRSRVIEMPMVPARGLIPPELTGGGLRSQESRVSAPGDARRTGEDLAMSILAAPSPGGILLRLAQSFAAIIEPYAGSSTVRELSHEELTRVLDDASADIVFGRWIATYPDADCFAQGLLDQDFGALRNFLPLGSPGERVRALRMDPSPERRRAGYLELERELLREGLIVPLYHEQSYRFVSPDLERVRFTFSWPTVAYDEIVSLRDR